MHAYILRASRLAMLLGSLGLTAGSCWAQDAPVDTAIEPVPTADLGVATEEVGALQHLLFKASLARLANARAASRKSHRFFKTMKQKWHQFDKEQFHPDHCWPQQYSRESQRRVYAPLRQQLLNGQILESMIWLHYFDENEPTQLNAAGESRLQYLASRRTNVSNTVGLQTSFDDALDQQRMVVVNDYLARVTRQSIAWNVVPMNRGKPWGLFGLEGPKTIDNMVGIAGQPPRYQPQIMQSFLTAGDDSQN